MSLVPRPDVRPDLRPDRNPNVSQREALLEVQRWVGCYPRYGADRRDGSFHRYFSEETRPDPAYSLICQIEGHPQQPGFALFRQIGFIVFEPPHPFAAGVDLLNQLFMLAIV